MSRTPYFYVERFNKKTNQYELEHLKDRIDAFLEVVNGWDWEMIIV